MASSSRLKPDEKGRISVTVNIRGRAGTLIKTVHVHTNDPARPTIDLSVRVEIGRKAGAKKGV